MRASGMSATAIRRALGLSAAAALASGLLESRTLAQALGPGAPRAGRAAACGPGGGSGRGPRMAEVRDAVARACGLDPETLGGRDQRRPVARARHLAMHLIRELCPGASLPAIGFLLNRDHTTVLYGCRRAQARLGRDATYRALRARARRELGRGTIAAAPRG